MLRIFWFRKDLRIDDNAGLKQFIADTNDDDEYMFLYIKNKNTYEYFGEKRIYFLYQALASLSKSLHKHSRELIITEGNSLEVFNEILSVYKSISVYANKQPEPYSRKRDEDVRKLLEKRGSELNLFTDSTIFPLGEILKGDGKPYVVFTPFMKSFYSMLNKAYYAKSDSDLNKLKGKEYKKHGLKALEPEKEMKTLKDSEFFDGSREEGIKQLEKFWKDKLESYRSKRDFPAVYGTSRLSPHFHFGTVGIREAFRTGFNKINRSSSTKVKTESRTWLNELIWREFYYNITFHFPGIIKDSFNKQYDKLSWNKSRKDFTAWCEGKTGYPIVDAGMRQLVKEGWMHNRVRMITAMFLTKHLLIDWRKGEKFFADHLVDLDFSSNNGGWQWSASTGVDAAPYFRIFNPTLQSKKFDAKGEYIKEYLPELKGVPVKYIHAPWALSDNEQKHIGIKIGKDYPAPIVDHKQAREIAIKEYKSIA